MKSANLIDGKATLSSEFLIMFNQTRIHIN